MIKVLCANPPGGAFYHITEAWANAFRALGHKFKKWNGELYAWKEFKPDLYLGCSGHPQTIPQKFRKNTAIGIHCNPYSSKRLNIIHGNDINEPNKAITYTIKSRPDFVFGYGLQRHEKYWAHYNKKHGIPWYGVPTAGDATHYFHDPKDEMKCDIGYVGGRWPYKAHNLNKYLVPVLKKHNYKLFGWGGWDGFKYKTLPNGTNKDRHLFSSAKICPAVCEPHTTIYGIDWPERIFKVPLCRGFTISDKIINFDDYLDPSIFPMARDPDEYMELIDHYLENDGDRIDLASRQNRYILSKHTYFDRVKTLMEAAGFSDESREVDRFKENFRFVNLP